MKKSTIIIYLSLAAIVAGSFVSCQDEEMGYTKEEIAYSKFEKEYNINFEREYGKIAPGHTWGFGNRALTRSADQPTRYKIIRQQGYVDLPGNQKEYFSVDPQHQNGGGASTVEERQYAGRNCPPAVSDEEKAYVFAYLRKYPNGGTTTCALDNYFMQDLHQDPTPDPVHGTEHCPGWGHINNLYFDGVHFNDYNGTSQSPDYYVVHTNIVNPSYQDSYGTNGNNGPARENRYRYYYIPVDPTVTPAAPAGFKGGFYLCFDYESKKNENANGTGNGIYASVQGAEEPFGKPDGVYNDWVIKLTPGQYDKHRVFCEDLGSTHDLDFNDLVFDYTEYGDFIELNVIALIGTLKINVIGPDGAVVPIKTGNNQQYNINDWYTFSGSNISINDLKFSVESVGPMGQCFIANTPGKAPYMLQVPAGTQWPGEGVRIESLHPFFKEYVISPNDRPDWWNEPTVVQHTFSGSELNNVAQYIEKGHEYTLIVTLSEPTYFSYAIGWDEKGSYFSGTNQFVFTAGDSFRIAQGGDKVSSLVIKEVTKN